jgi:hypothetical protein
MDFDPSARRRRPPEFFYVFKLDARQLRALSGIQRRSADRGRPRAEDIGIQRAHDPSRSSEIARFVEYGFPSSTLTERERGSGRFEALRKPGWLPTAVVVNILTSNDRRPEGRVRSEEIVTVAEAGDGFATIDLPGL